jgi:hypothetical protein
MISNKSYYPKNVYTHERRKTIKFKDGNPSNKSTRQMRTQIDTTQRENKSKQSTKMKIKSGKRPDAKRTQNNKMTKSTITKKKT